MDKGLFRRVGTWYECSAKYFDNDNGTTKKTKVCVNAESFADAEHKALRYFIELKGSAVNNLRIVAITIASYTEVFFQVGVFWFKASMKALDGEKDVILLRAEDIVETHETLNHKIIEPEQHWEITKLEQTDIFDVIGGNIEEDGAPIE